MGAAISASVAQRPSGICSRKGPWTSSRPQYQADIGVITTVGLTPLTRMLYFPSSKADTRVMLSRAAFDDPYEMWPRSATRLAWLETLTIEPPRTEPDHGAGGVLGDQQGAAGVDRDHLVEHVDVQCPIGVAISPAESAAVSPRRRHPSPRERCGHCLPTSGRTAALSPRCRRTNGAAPPPIGRRRWTRATGPRRVGGPFSPPIPPLAPVTRIVRPPKSATV